MTETITRDLSRNGERVRVKLGAEPLGRILYERAGLIFVELDDERFNRVVAGYRPVQLDPVTGVA